MVEKHIKSLLYDHDCVIIPDFGGLITRYVSARIHPVKNALMPPSKKIAFNEKLTLNDGLLISTIAYKNSLSKEEAQQIIFDFVRQAKHKLNAGNRFELSGIGVFKYNAEQRLEFEYVESDNFLEDSFGLPELVARPLRVEDPAVLRTLLKERHQQLPVTSKKTFKGRLKRFTRVAASLSIVGLTASALYFLSLQTDYNLSSLNPISLFGGNHAAANNFIAKRYASDYVPFTLDERLAAYDKIMPANNIYDAEAELEEENSAYELPVNNETLGLEEVAEPAVKEEVKVSEVPVEDEKTKEPVLTIKEKTGRSYIITGGYSTLENAELSRKAIAKKGHEAKVILPMHGSKLFRVAVADFADNNEAKEELGNYKKSFGETIWVLNY
ncbi:HU family DNA-binding protein [Pontibacter silvestris]|uniref:HU family DNA-binding protein n=1 Tax=Pontibacter silvestris TaxID=2305183 RepID=A0ABW4WYS5_9BACT|nr:HU family DNA-binding protein [Pontibacter silvestris]MCC9135278.1 HU family DNA-binding protein [Pontibacter silvestris]